MKHNLVFNFDAKCIVFLSDVVVAIVGIFCDSCTRETDSHGLQSTFAYQSADCRVASLLIVFLTSLMDCLFDKFDGLSF